MTITPNPYPQYVFQEFPKWKYHPDREPVIVDDYDAEKALGADWYDTPGEAKAALTALQAQKQKLEAAAK